MSDAPAKTVLHVGCGPARPDALPARFAAPQWSVARLDGNPNHRPDFVAEITDMRIVDSGSMDALYSSHDLEHLPPHEVARALAEFRRVLKPGGTALVGVTDLQQAAALVAEDKADDPLYDTSLGPVTALDLIYGHREAQARGNRLMIHRTGFTASTLGKALADAGFTAVDVSRDAKRFSVWARARAAGGAVASAAPAEEQDNPAQGPFGS